jgi:hypothetical protein
MPGGAGTDLSKVPTIYFTGAWFENELAGAVVAIKRPPGGAVCMQLAGRYAYEIVAVNGLKPFTQSLRRFMIRSGCADRPDEVLECPFAAGAFAQVRFNIVISNGIQLAVQIGVDQVNDFLAVRRCSSFRTRSARHCLRCDLVRASRDITVPGGTWAMSAISL